MTKMSPYLWYTDKADEAAAFYASKVEPGKYIGRLNVRARIDHRDRKPRTVDFVVCHPTTFR
jgi:predicted 3-demethylubiquinone-9 3-methyltransferase (glyoxalase superfamily)